jgi:hypothetical protein
MKRFYENGIKVNGIMDHAVQFVVKHQLKDQQT